MNLPSGIAQDWIVPIGWMLVHTVWQAALAALLLAIVLRLLRRASASVRYWIACAAMLSVVAAAAGTIGIHRPEKHRLLASGGAARIQTDLKPQISDLKFESPDPTALPMSRARGPERALPIVVCVWVIGVIGLSLWQLGGWMLLRHYRRKAINVDPQWMQRLARIAGLMRIKRIAMKCTDRLEVPIVVGALRPAILVPIAMLNEMSIAQVEVILAHELAHVRRHDYLINLIQSAIETLLFYHPAIWWISKQIRREREFACDDLAIGAFPDRARYATALATLEQTRSLRLAPALGGGGRSELVLRVRRLLAPMPRIQPRNRLDRAKSAAGAMLILLAALIAGSRTPWLRAQSTTRPVVAALPPTTSPPSNSSITPDDFIAVREDYRISSNDMLQVTVSDLGPNQTDLAKATRVSETGIISLPMLNPLKAAGLTEAELEAAIVKAYFDASILARARVTVSIMEARNRVFSIVGEVESPGQYALHDADFHLFDAMTLARGIKPNNGVRVVRRTSDPANPRVIEIPGPIAIGDPKINIVIKPGDAIVVLSAPKTASASAAPDSDVQRALDANVAASQEAWEELQKRAQAGEALTPAFVQLQMDTAKRVYDATVLTTNDSSDRVSAAEKYLARLNGLADTLEKRRGQDVTTVQISQAKMMIAEAKLQLMQMRPTTQPGPNVRPQSMTSMPFKIVVAKGKILRSGKETNWEQIAQFLTSLRDHTRVYIALYAVSNDLPFKELFDAQTQAEKLTRGLGLDPQRVTGVDPDGGKPSQEYFMGGLIARPGVYSLSGRQITLKQAIVSAGMLPGFNGALKDLPDNYTARVSHAESFQDVSLLQLFDGRAMDIVIQPEDLITVFYGPDNDRQMFRGVAN